MPSANLITIDHLALKLNCTSTVIRRLVKLRKIPFVRLGHRTLRFDLEEVRAALIQPVATEERP